MLVSLLHVQTCDHRQCLQWPMVATPFQVKFSSFFVQFSVSPELVKKSGWGQFSHLSSWSLSPTRWVSPGLRPTPSCSRVTRPWTAAPWASAWGSGPRWSALVWSMEPQTPILVEREGDGQPRIKTQDSSLVEAGAIATILPTTTITIPLITTWQTTLLITTTPTIPPTTTTAVSAPLSPGLITMVLSMATAEGNHNQINIT